MEVHRMSIVCAVAHHQAVAHALFQYEFAFMRVGLAVDEPEIELAGRAGYLLENRFNGLLRSAAGGAGGSEDCIVPRRLRRIDPLRLAMLPSIFHDHAEARFADRFLG